MLLNTFVHAETFLSGVLVACIFKQIISQKYGKILDEQLEIRRAKRLFLLAICGAALVLYSSFDVFVTDPSFWFVQHRGTWGPQAFFLCMLFICAFACTEASAVAEKINPQQYLVAALLSTITGLLLLRANNLLVLCVCLEAHSFFFSFIFAGAAHTDTFGLKSLKTHLSAHAMVTAMMGLSLLYLRDKCLMIPSISWLFGLLANSSYDIEVINATVQYQDIVYSLLILFFGSVLKLIVLPAYFVLQRVNGSASWTLTMFFMVYMEIPFLFLTIKLSMLCTSVYLTDVGYLLVFCWFFTMRGSFSALFNFNLKSALFYNSLSLSYMPLFGLGDLSLGEISAMICAEAIYYWTFFALCNILVWCVFGRVSYLLSSSSNYAVEFVPVAAFVDCLKQKPVLAFMFSFGLIGFALLSFDFCFSKYGVIGHAHTFGPQQTITFWFLISAFSGLYNSFIILKLWKYTTPVTLDGLILKLAAGPFISKLFKDEYLDLYFVWLSLYYFLFSDFTNVFFFVLTYFEAR